MVMQEPFKHLNRERYPDGQPFLCLFAGVSFDGAKMFPSETRRQECRLSLNSNTEVEPDHRAGTAR